MNEKEKAFFETLTNDDLSEMAYALECRYGLNNELADRIYNFLQEKTGVDYR